MKGLLQFLAGILKERMGTQDGFASAMRRALVTAKIT
jgi:hypothetical protein